MCGPPGPSGLRGSPGAVRLPDVPGRDRRGGWRGAGARGCTVTPTDVGRGRRFQNDQRYRFLSAFPETVQNGTGTHSLLCRSLLTLPRRAERCRHASGGHAGPPWGGSHPIVRFRADVDVPPRPRPRDPALKAQVSVGNEVGAALTWGCLRGLWLGESWRPCHAAHFSAVLEGLTRDRGDAEPAKLAGPSSRDLQRGTLAYPQSSPQRKICTEG